MPGQRSKRPCGNPECSTSTGACGALTFGRGDLDALGYWEIPCRVCAAEFDRNREEVRAQTRSSLRSRGNSDAQIEAYLSDPDNWLNLPAWPLAPEVELNEVQLERELALA